MKFWETVKKCMLNINFKGRNTRKEYIFFKIFQFLFGFLGFLFVFIPLIFLAVVLAGKSGSVPNISASDLPKNITVPAIYCALAFLIYLPLSIWVGIANLCVSVKRLHDLNYSGWIYLAYIIILMCLTFVKDQYGIASSIVVLATFAELIIFACLKGTDGANKFDEPTKEIKNDAPEDVYLLQKNQEQ
ncbi:MAG: DUF805 domain-containing protein [Candidatus Gastranaerophilales bacterium]|nr:DUF805 domain-containing protein [Candidatus Gastranaerophilales bacterium]